MAELIYKGMLKNCYAGDFRMDGKTPCMATYESIRKMIDIQPTTTEAEIRAKAIDEFAERLKEKILEEIDDVSESQRNYEVGSDMSLTCSHIMGTLRDVYHRVIDEIEEEMKAGGKNE